MSKTLLKIIGGPQKGAELTLVDGAYLLGTVDECDLILADEKVVERHLLIKIQNGSATILPIGNAPVWVNDELIEAACDYQEFAHVNLGATVLAMGSPNGDWPELIGINDLDEAPVAELDEEETVAEAQVAPQRFSRRKLLALTGPGGLLVMMLILFFAPTGDKGMAETNRVDTLQRIQGVLNQYGINELSLSHATQGTGYKLTGFLPLTQQKEELAAGLRDADLSVEMAVWAEDSIQNSVHQVLDEYDLRLGMNLEQGRLTLNGITPDPKLLAHVLEILEQDVPGLLSIESRVHTPQDLYGYLVKALPEHGLEGVIKLRFEDGHLIAHGSPDAVGLQAWDQLKGEIRKDYGLEIGERFKERGPKRKVKAGPRLQLDVLSIHVGEISYITLADGQKLFEGARLDSGHVVTTIESEKIIFTYGGNQLIYRPGGRK